jgi:MscS family membrane protein
VIIWVIGFITVFGNLWYNVNAIIAWAWIWGLAIAFAAQKSISQMFWAVTILLNKPFKVWDSVKINWITWTIKDIWLSYVEMTETSGYKVMIPNDAIMSTNIENLTTRKNRKTEFVLWLEYDTSTLKLKKWIDTIKNILQKYVDEKTIGSYRVTFDDFWQFSLNIKVLYYSLLNKDFWEYASQKEEINFEIKKTFEKLWIEMAFPTQEILLKKLWGE